MSDLSLTPSGSPSHNDSPETLTDRVALRVMNARLAIEERLDRRQSKVSRPGETTSQSEAELRETASLKRVFRELGTSYRRYRSQTRTPVVPGLRAAAENFRSAPSLASLIAVAAYLDELDLLN
ncbi:MAG TPA: hypothetical protein VHH32_01480 [Gemmatimonadales bacterium]|nr:hypothetical protein [Gemmatimonadales bacterium]